MSELSRITNLSLEYYLAAAMACSRRIFAALDIQWDPEKGMNRLAYTPTTEEAMDIITKEAQDLGMHAYQLLSGSRMFVLLGEDPTLPPEMVSSHIDTVQNGGRYDGAAGVVAGLSAIAALRQRQIDTGVRPKRTIVVLADANEESPIFKQFAVSSKINAGAVGPEILDLKSIITGKTLRQSMLDLGYGEDRIARLEEMLTERKPLIPFDMLNKAWEMHIEQGKRLTTAGNDIGIVTAFRGNVRYSGLVQFEGREDHTGATEMEDRLDAGDGLDLFKDIIRAECKKLRDAGKDLVFTFHFATDNKFSSISKNAWCHVEARTTDKDVLVRIEKIVEEAADKVRKLGYGVNTNQDKINRTPPVTLGEENREIIKRIADGLGISSMEMASGAGHDMMIYSLLVSGGFIFTAHGNDGLSHNKGEILGTTPDADPFALNSSYAKTTNVLMHILTRDERSEPLPEPDKRAARDFILELVNRGAKPLAPNLMAA